jgi:hypothetical protein
MYTLYIDPVMEEKEWYYGISAENRNWEVNRDNLC